MESENQLLKQNTSDLRKTLQNAQNSERAAQNVLEVLKDSMNRDKQLVNDLLVQKQEIQERLRQFELKGIDGAHIEAIQLSMKQILSLGNKDSVFVDGNDSRSVQKNISQVTQIVFDLQQHINKLLQEQSIFKDQLSNQKTISDQLLQKQTIMQNEFKQQMREKDQNHQEQVQNARQEIIESNKRQIKQLEDKLGQYDTENKQLKETADILKLQLQTIN